MLDRPRPRSQAVTPACIIYRITNAVNGKVYIGITGNLSARWSAYRSAVKRHMASPSRRRGRQPIHAAMAKHGIGAFYIEPIASARTWEDGFALEAALIKQYRSMERAFGYNATSGGEGTPGAKRSAETLARMSAAQKGRPGHPWPSERRLKQSESMKLRRKDPTFAARQAAVSAAQRGVPRSEAIKEKIRKAHAGRRPSDATIEASRRACKGKKRPPEHVEKIRLARLGSKRSDETRAKISRSNSGKVRSAEVRIRISDALKGRAITEETRERLRARRHSEETKAKMSASRKGKKKSPEHAAAISAGLKARAAARREVEAGRC